MALSRKLTNWKPINTHLNHFGISGFGMGCVQFRQLDGCVETIIEGHSHQLLSLALYLSQDRGVSPLENALNNTLWRTATPPFAGDLDQHPITIPGMVQLVISQINVLASVFPQRETKPLTGGADPCFKNSLVGTPTDALLSTGDHAHLDQGL